MINEIPSEIPSIAPAEPAASAGTASIGSTGQSLLSAMEACSTGISPTASFLSHLEILQQGDPAEFSKVETSVATQLHDDASRALLEGERTQANTLNHVAALFEASAESGLVPTLDALHAAGLSQDHHHGHDAAQIDATAVPAPTPSPANDSIEVILAGAVSKAIDS
jgi:hypothetical protein